MWTRIQNLKIYEEKATFLPFWNSNSSNNQQENFVQYAPQNQQENVAQCAALHRINSYNGNSPAFDIE